MTRKSFFLIFENVIKLCGDNFALSWSTANESFAITYKSLDNLIERLKQFLICNIDANNVYVGLCMQSKVLTIPLIIALWKNNQAPVPLSNYNSDILCQNLKIKYIISDFKPSFKNSVFKKIKVQNIELFICETQENEVQICSDELEICYVLCTSGSTGIPKPVQVPWTCILPNAKELLTIFQINESDVISSFSSFTFDPFFIDLFFAMLTGANLILQHNNSEVFQKDLFDYSIDCDIVKTKLKNVTIMQITPSVFKTIQNESLCKNLRILILGGELFPQSLPPLPNSLVYNIYGITEISCWSFLHKVTTPNTKVPIGLPLSDVFFKIEKNELLIGSKIRKCLVGEESVKDYSKITYRRTGDLVEYDSINNEIFILGRKDNVIKIFGTKVQMENVRNLLHSLDFLKDLSIIFDDEFQTIGWFLVYNDSSINEIEKCNINQLSELNIVFSQLSNIEKPGYIFKINPLPISSHGKRDNKRLKQILKNEIHKTRTTNFEESFKAVCYELLGQTIDFNKSFVECGGNSILAMRLMNLLDKSQVKSPEKLITYLLTNHSLIDCMKLAQNYSADNSLVQSLNQNKTYKLTEKWTFNMQKCIDGPARLLELDGKLYVAVGSHSSQLSLVSSDNGAEIWSIFLEDRIESGIATSPDKKYLYTASYDQHIYCLCSKTGTIRWKTRTGGMIKSTPVFSASLNHIYCGSYDKQFYCLNAENGGIIASLLLSGSLLATAVMSDEMIFSGSLAGECFCVNAENFEMKWKTDVPSPIFSSPCLLSRQRVLVAEVEGTLHCFHLNDGKKAWEFKCGGNIFSSLIKIHQTNLVVFGCHDRHLYLIDAANKPSLKWKRQLESAIACTPAVYESLITCVTSCGILNLLDFDGNILAKLNIGGEAFSTPQFFKNSIYLGCRNDNLICIDVECNLLKN